MKLISTQYVTGLQTSIQPAIENVRLLEKRMKDEELGWMRSSI